MFCKAAPWRRMPRLLLSAGLAWSADSRRPNLLIEAEELAQPEFAKGVRILDVRPWQHLRGRAHVAGAVWVDLDGLGQGVS